MRVMLILALLLAGCGRSPGIGPYQPEPDEPARDGSRGKPLLAFVGSESASVPEGWTLEGEGAAMRMVQDMALDGRGFLQITQSGAGEAVLRIPLDVGRAGRLALRLRARSPQSKWLQISATAAGEGIWKHNFPLAASWQDGAWGFTIPPAVGHDAALTFRFAGEGALELEMLDVAGLDPDALRTLAKQRHGGRVPANLLRNSRLPLGLQSGWNIDREYDDGEPPVLSGDPDAPGPSGFASLRVAGDRTIRFYSEPFSPALPGEPHVASVFVRGSGGGTLRVLQDAKPLEAVVELPASDQWTRVELPFATDPLAQHYALQFDVKGPLWMDGFHVADGTKAATLSSSGDCEVALAPPNPGRILFEDAPSRLRWMVTGAPAGAHLNSKIVNLYGRQVVLPPQRLDGSAVAQGETDVAVFPDHPLGTLRWEAWVTDQSGKRISPYNELVVHRIRRPRHPDSLAPDSPFGIHTLPTTRHIAMARAIGMTWVRLHDAGGLEWYHLEPEPGQWVFRDDTIRRFRDSKFEILGLLGTSPLWANAWPDTEKKPIHSFWDKWGAPGDPDAFARYVRTVTDRYRKDIRVYEVWNEPWIPRFFSARREPQPRGEPLYFHSDHPQRDYAGLSRTAAAALADGDTGVRLVGLNSTAGTGISNRISGADWSAGVVAEGGVDAINFLSYHHYTTARAGYPGDDVEAGFQRAIGPAMRDGVPMQPVWLTEGSNTPAGTAGTFYRHSFHDAETFDPEASADALARYVVAMLAAGNQKIFLYSMHAHGLLGGHYRFTTLITPDGYLHPDAIAFSNLAWWIEGRRFVSRKSTEAATLYSFAGEEGRITIVIPSEGRPVGVRSGLTAVDLWGNPLGDRPTQRTFIIPSAADASDLRY